MWWQTILFLGLFLPLRMNAGGYHTRNRATCYMLSTIIMTLSLRIIGQATWSGKMFFAILLLSMMLVLRLAPVADDNKPLEEEEKTRYRNRVKWIITGYSISSILAWWGEMPTIAVCILMAIAVSAVLLSVGAIKNNGLMKARCFTERE